MTPMMMPRVTIKIRASKQALKNPGLMSILQVEA
jgi:hypothetical protein